MAMAASTQFEKDSRAKGSKVRERGSIREKAKARHQDSRDNAIRVVNMGIRRASARTAMGSQKVKGRNRQSATIVATQGTLRQIAPRERGKARQ